MTDSKGLSRIEHASAGKLSASPTADDCANIAVSMNKRAQEIASGLPPDLNALPRLNGFRLRGIALGFAAIALEMVLLNLRAWRLREPLRLNVRERVMTFHEVTAGVFQSASESFRLFSPCSCRDSTLSGAAGFISPWSFWCRYIGRTQRESQNRKHLIALISCCLVRAKSNSL